MTTLSDMLAMLSPQRRTEVKARAKMLVEEERRRVYFRAGEVLTCENGHEIADIVQNADKHQMPSLNQFANWRNVEREPEKGTMPQHMTCTICGARFCRFDWIGGFIIHIGSTWRTDDPERWGLHVDEASDAP